jgi:serine phosphatase RsbU (regulator of sigma subunit)/anti-sigma regulatory factor (Ser/Thr protein kinase)
MTEAAEGLEVGGPAGSAAPPVVAGLAHATGEQVVLGLLDAMFAEAPVGLAVFDRDLRLVRLNRTLEATSGRSTGEVRGRTVAEAGLLSLTCPERLDELLRSVLDSGEPCINAELHGRAAGAPAAPGRAGAAADSATEVMAGVATGTMRVWSVSLFRLHDQAGDPAGVGGLVLDDTDRLRAETAARLANDRLALLATASHVLGNSLETGETLQALTGVTVPAVADVAMIDLVDGKGRLRRQARASTPDASGPHVWAGRGEPVEIPDAHPVRRALAEQRTILATSLSETDLLEFSPSVEVAEDAHRIGLHSLLSVPLISHTGTLGVATFGRVAGRAEFDDAELVLAEQLADRAAVAIEHAELFAREREIALTLQRSLLPAHLPEAEGLEVESYYLPGTAGTEVGGDWFDLIPLPAGRVGIMIGDVMGRGMTAAAVMGQLRAAARAYAALDLPPDEVLNRLDSLVRGLDDEGAGQLVTCVYAVYDPGSWRCQLANAGHLPPILSSEQPRRIAEASGVPLGVGGFPLTADEITIEPGQALVLYTDGLVEQRGQDLDAGIDRLCSLLTAPLGDDLKGAFDRVLTTLRPAGGYEDDVAVLVVRAPSSGAGALVATLELPGEPASGRMARGFAGRILDSWGLESRRELATLLVSELVTNAIGHSDGAIGLRLRCTQRILCVEVSDTDTRRPRLREPGPEDEAGRGLYLVDRLADRWGVRPLPDGKVVWCEVALPATAG